MDPKLALAATTGDIDGILKFKKQIDQANPDGNTVLHLAAVSNQSDCVEAILKKFPHLMDKVNSRKETALHLSASKGYSDVVHLLIQKSEAVDSGIIDSLMKSKDLDHEVVRELDSEVADIFIKKYSVPGKDKRVTAIDFIRKGNVDLDTALHLAVRYNHPKVVDVIVKADRGDRHSQNTNLETPFYMAVAGGYRETFKIMFEKCRDPGCSGPEGKTVLHAAIERRDTEIARSVLKELTYLYNIADEKGWTAFHYAAYHNCGSLLSFLLGKKGYFNGMSVEAVLRCRAKITNMSALHVAASRGNVSIVIELMRFYTKDANHVPESNNIVNTTTEVDEEGPNMWRIPAHHNHNERTIVAPNTDPLAYNEFDEEGQNILHMAAANNHKELIRSILTYSPDIRLLLNTEDKNGNTPLHLLVKSGCFVPELIKHKDIVVDAKNKDNFTPYDLMYLEDEIIEDQLMIKNAFENNEAIHHPHNFFSSAFWSCQRKITIFEEENSAIPSKRRIKDAKFEAANAKIMKNEVELYRARTNTQIVVTALITTVTFTVGFTMPGGYNQSGGVNEGSAVLSKKKAFQAFMIADTIALVLSTASLFLYFLSSLYQDPHEISKFNAASTGLNIVSVIAMMFTFISGTYVVLPHSPALTIPVFVISCLFFILVFLLLIKCLRDPIKKFKV